MFTDPIKSEIDEHTGKLIVGVIALSLASITSYFSTSPLESISASYYEEFWARDIFVGFLYAIAAFLLTYNGRSKRQMILSKVAAFSAIGVAMFPCECGDHEEIIANVHGLSATIMFLILAMFCYTFFKRAIAKESRQAKYRAYIYAACGFTIIISILILGYDSLSNYSISSKITRLTFYGENAGLVSFGIAWLTASRMLPLLTGKDERLSVF